MSEQPPKDRKPLITHLIKLKEHDNRAALATLRRGLVDFGNDFSIYSVVGHLLPSRGTDSDIEKYLLTACLFATHPSDTSSGRSIGSAARILRSKLKVGQESLDNRFSALLNSDEEDLPVRLRHIVNLLKSREISLDYDTLLSDLLRWGSDRRRTQKNWAKDYWAGKEEAKQSKATADEESTVEETTNS